MAERAQRIGGTLEVLSRPGRGTSVVLSAGPGPRHPPRQPAVAAASDMLAPVAS
jgi:hypothetical protein